MKNTYISLGALLVAIAAIGLHFYQKAPKIGFAETSVLLAEFNEAVAARKEFEGYQKEWDKNLKSINDSLMASMARIKSEFEKADEKGKQKLRSDIEKWNSDLQRYSQAVKKMSQEKEAELMGPVLSKMNTFMKEWGAKKGYSIIFGTIQGGNLLQADEKLNVTRKLLADLNEYYPPKNKFQSEVKENDSKSSNIKTDSSSLNK